MPGMLLSETFSVITSFLLIITMIYEQVIKSRVLSGGRYFQHSSVLIQIWCVIPIFNLNDKELWNKTLCEHWKKSLIFQCIHWFFVILWFSLFPRKSFVKSWFEFHANTIQKQDRWSCTKLMEASISFLDITIEQNKISKLFLENIINIVFFFFFRHHYWTK